ncbi:MAG: SpoIIIAH-like family protein [Bacilli bacterium]|nr:SpoIIIAH-like family protein [Bacilli bacterium]
MIKKNQFALIFLTIVTMLAVWYIKSPVSADKENDNDNTTPVINEEESGRLEELALMREAIRNERSLAVVSLDAVIADEEASLASKEAALQEKEAISALTEKEVLLELQVINSGYQDALVHATDTGIEVIVVSDEDSAAKANEIILMTLASFEGYDTVVVNFMSEEELKG